MEAPALLITLGGISTLLGIIFGINQYFQKIQSIKTNALKEQTKEDNRQDLDITTLKERVRSLEEQMTTLRAADVNLEEKVLKHFEKLENKIDTLNNKILEVLQQIIK